MSDDGIPLVEVLRSLRAQLSRAAQESVDADIRFEIGKVEVELVGRIEKTASGEAGAEFKVLGVGGKLGGAGKLADEQTQKISLTLTPMQRVPATDAAQPVEPMVHSVLGWAVPGVPFSLPDGGVLGGGLIGGGKPDSWRRPLVSPPSPFGGFTFTDLTAWTSPPRSTR